MAEATRGLVAGPVEAEAWAPFGWVPVADTDPADGIGSPRVRVGGPSRERDQPRARRGRARRRGARL